MCELFVTTIKGLIPISECMMGGLQISNCFLLIMATYPDLESQHFADQNHKELL